MIAQWELSATTKNEREEKRGFVCMCINMMKIEQNDQTSVAKK